MSLNAPEKFDFPFIPYPIQHEFMKNLYEVIENKKLGIFESPTGTGKSLSIICGALRWLRDHNEQERISIASEIKTIEDIKAKLATDTADGINTEAEEIELTHKLKKLKIQQNGIAEYDKKIKKLCSKKKIKNVLKSSKTDSNKLNKKVQLKDNEESCDHDMLDDNIVESDEELDNDDGNKYEPVKILICSRTHSQLSQMIGEIIKSPFGTNTRALSLSSRKNYCVNPAVLKLKNISLINEKCLDMQKTSKNNKVDTEGKVLKGLKGSSGQCPYNNQENIEKLRDSALTSIQDIEDLVKSAKKLNACPYYASLKAAEDAQVVLVPYNTLLHKNTRESSGLKLKNNVVIIDEAHNLLEALAQMHSSEISYFQLQEAFTQLTAYKNKYLRRFAAEDLLCIDQILFIISNLICLLDKNVSQNSNNPESEVYTVKNFVLSADIHNYDMFKLLKFCRTSKIADKLHSFSSAHSSDIEKALKKDKKNRRTKVKDLESIENTAKDNVVPVEVTCDNSIQLRTPTGNPFLIFLSFLEALTCTYEDGRIFAYRCQDNKQSKLKFLLLNPAVQFQEIVKDARSVIVAGGTMKPISVFKNQLFIGAGASVDRIVKFSCDHIIPPEHILPLVVTKGLQEEKLSMGSCLKEILLEVSSIVKGGTVVLFPSYKYEASFCRQIRGTKFGKPIFREQQNSDSVDSVLNSYADVIRKQTRTGALLFCVVGGKLSEGLNFRDNLGRCVIVVGLPYASTKSPELKEQMTYLDKAEGKRAGKRFYQALCMKSVNQCIGRAVTHKDDYACVLLLDERYDRIETKKSLPDWITRSLKTRTFKDGTELMKSFFSDMKCNMNK